MRRAKWYSRPSCRRRGSNSELNRSTELRTDPTYQSDARHRRQGQGPKRVRRPCRRRKSASRTSTSPAAMLKLALRDKEQRIAATMQPARPMANSKVAR